MRAGKARASEREWRARATHYPETWRAAPRKLSWWQRLKRWLNNP